MEFPDLGSHCANSACNRLDFLPLKCDACGKLFCSDHLAYDSHDCPEKYRKNAQVCKKSLDNLFNFVYFLLFS